MKITIVGFGNIAHALIAYLGSKSDVELSVLASQPYISDKIVSVDQPQQRGDIEKISDDPSVVIPDSDMILFTVPSHIRRSILQKVAPYISESTILGAFPGIGGFYDEVREVIGENVTVFASQRVPYIARIVEKGRLVKATPKEIIHISVSKQGQKIQEMLSNLLEMEVTLLDDFMEVNLTNSNPILHSARLYSLLQKNTYPFEEEILFYEEWDDAASKILLNMDKEFMILVNKLQLKNICSLKEHYGVNTLQEMTRKMRSIEAFKGIKAPLKKMDNGYVFDTSSRYFQEDIGHDLFYILYISKKNSISVSTMTLVYNTLNQSNKL